MEMLSRQLTESLDDDDVICLGTFVTPMRTDGVGERCSRWLVLMLEEYILFIRNRRETENATRKSKREQERYLNRTMASECV